MKRSAREVRGSAKRERKISYSPMLAGKASQIYRLAFPKQSPPVNCELFQLKNPGSVPSKNLIGVLFREAHIPDIAYSFFYVSYRVSVISP